jgi:Phospholipase_D-nuclease N-terminal
MLFQGGFTFTNFVADAFAVFMFVLWFWLFISVAGDLFRRHDVSGVGKVCWVILLIILPYVGIFVYLLTLGRAWLSVMKRELSRPMMIWASSWASAPPTRLKSLID